MSPWTRLLPALTALTAAALLAGCAGQSSMALPKTEFIRQADAICTRGSAEQNRLPEPASAKELVAHVRTIYAIERDVVADVRALAAPDDDRALIVRMLDNVDKALALEPLVEAAARSGNQSQINEAQAGGARYLNAARAIASEYGFRACGA